VMEELPKMKAATGAEIEFQQIFNQADYINESLGNLSETALFGILITFLTLLFLNRQLAARTRRFAGHDLPGGLRLLLQLQRRTKVFPLLAVSLLVGSKYLDLPTRAERLATGVMVVLVAVQLGLWASAAVRFYLEDPAAGARNQKSKAMVTIAQFVANLAIWSLVALLALDNLGFEVKTLLAGLGIGGIAVALAVQNVLGDLFASVSIALDKPFEIGDALTLDSGYTGTVEAVGIKSTRLRSTSGEQIVVANAELVKARIRNYGRIAERRPLEIELNVVAIGLRDGLNRATNTEKEEGE